MKKLRPAIARLLAARNSREAAHDQRHQAGFSPLELLVAIGMVALLAILVVLLPSSSVAHSLRYTVPRRRTRLA